MKNIRSSCSHCGAERWDQRTAKKKKRKKKKQEKRKRKKKKKNNTETKPPETQKTKGRNPTFVPDNFFIN